jgi:hypothetical protein
LHIGFLDRNGAKIRRFCDNFVSRFDRSPMSELKQMILSAKRAPDDSLGRSAGCVGSSGSA